MKVDGKDRDWSNAPTNHRMEASTRRIDSTVSMKIDGKDGDWNNAPTSHRREVSTRSWKR